MMMTPEEIRGTVEQIVAEILGVSRSEFTDESTLMGDLEADSLDIAEISAALRQKDIDVDKAAIMHAETFGVLVGLAVSAGQAAV